MYGKNANNDDDDDKIRLTADFFPPNCVSYLINHIKGAIFSSLAKGNAKHVIIFILPAQYF